MSNYQNLVCTNCGNFFTAQIFEGSSTRTVCSKCIQASTEEGEKLAGTGFLFLIGLFVAALLLIFTEFKNPKQTAITLITLLLIFISVFILSKWGFIWFVVFAALCFGLNYFIKKLVNGNY